MLLKNTKTIGNQREGEMENEKNPTDYIEQCLVCNHHTIDDGCRRYDNPRAFLRPTGLFMCPSQGIVSDDGKQNTKVRVGQQKQRRNK